MRESLELGGGGALMGGGGSKGFLGHMSLCWAERMKQFSAPILSVDIW